MSIYKKVLGEQFKQLHHKLQQRYEIRASGVMKEIRGALDGLPHFYDWVFGVSFFFQKEGRIFLLP